MAGCRARARFPSSPASIISGPSRARVRDLALAYDAMQGPDPGDAACTARAAEPVTPLLGAASAACASQSPAASSRRALFPEAVAGGRARREGARRHRGPSRYPRPRAPARRPTSSPRPKARRCISTACASAPNDFDPAVRDRLIAGAMVPASMVDRAQKFRRWYRAKLLETVRVGRFASSRPRRPASRRNSVR